MNNTQSIIIRERLLRECLAVKNQSLRSRVLGSINRFFLRVRRIYG